MSVTSVSGRVDAVEEIDSAFHSLENICRRSHAHQIDGLFQRQEGNDFIQDMIHLLMRLADGKPADGIAVQVHFRDFPGVGDPDVLIDRPLVDSEQQLVPVKGIRQGIETSHFLLASGQPSDRPGRGCLDIAAFCQGVRTLIESHGDRGGQVRLNSHALFRSHKNDMSVNVRMKGHAFFLDLAQFRERKDLKAAGVRQDRSVPVHEFPDSSHFPDDFIPRAEMEMVGVAEFDFRSETFKFRRRDGSLDGTDGSDIHEHRCFDLSVNGRQDRPFRSSFCFQYLVHLRPLFLVLPKGNFRL